ncbi:MAG TPA: hypothetical protein VIV66_18955, partial [Pyrinomonadaceae bacterium]
MERGVAERSLPLSQAFASTRPRTVERLAEAKLPTRLGEFRLLGYRSLTSSEEFVVLAQGEMQAERPALVRIHSQCMTGDVFGSVK